MVSFHTISTVQRNKFKQTGFSFCTGKGSVPYIRQCCTILTITRSYGCLRNLKDDFKCFKPVTELGIKFLFNFYHMHQQTIQRLDSLDQWQILIALGIGLVDFLNPDWSNYLITGFVFSILCCA